MSEARTTHPTPQQLANYGLGKLPAGELSVIHTHVAACAECRKKVENQPPDSFIGQLRAGAVQGASMLPTVPPSPSNTSLPIRRPAEPAPDEVPAELLGSTKFKILGKLGQGGMGAVYKAQRSFLDDVVALKVMNAAVVENPEARSRFLREMKAAGQLKHPNIVRALDAEQMGELLVLVMEFVPGIALDPLVKQRGPLPVDFACGCIVQAAMGLQHAHEKGMVHRDIKPANLMVTAREKEVKLLDFGLVQGPSVQKGTRQTQLQTFMGTPEYVAPEQAGDARNADIRADIYSLGCTLYFLLAGRPPFKKDTIVNTIMAHFEDEAQPLTEVRKDMPAGLWLVVAKMMAKKPEGRFQTPIEVARALKPFAQGDSASPPATEGAGNLISNKTAGGQVKREDIFAAATVAPRAGVPNNRADLIRTATIAQGRPSGKSSKAAPPLPTQVKAKAPAADFDSARQRGKGRQAEEEGGGSLGGVLGWIACGLLMVGGLSGLGLLGYTLKAKKIETASVSPGDEVVGEKRQGRAGKSDGDKGPKEKRNDEPAKDKRRSPEDERKNRTNRRMSDWLFELENSETPTVRRNAAVAIGRMGVLAVSAVPDLARSVRDDPDPLVRDMAANAISDIVLSVKGFAPVNQWEQAGKPLEDALTGDKDPRVRGSAAYALGAFGPVAGPAVASLKKALRDTSPEVRQKAAWAWGRVGGAIDAAGIADLCILLADANPLVRRNAATALQNLGKSGQPATLKAAGKPLLDLVKNEKDEEVRKTALGTLATLSGPEHADRAAVLYPLLESKDPETQRGAAYVLANMKGEPAKKGAPVLRLALRDPDSNVQALAAAALANADTAAAPATDDLARVLTESKDPIVRRNCAIALGHIGQAAKSAVPALAAAMKSVADAPVDPKAKAPSEKVREQAAEAIALIRFPNNIEAMSTIRDVLSKDSNQIIRQRCVWALFNCPAADLDRHELTKTLADVLEEKAADSLMLRYDSARLLACSLREKAPDRTCDVLLGMIENNLLKVFDRTDVTIAGGPDGAKGDATVTAERSNGDARYMAAEAMAWMGEKSKNNKAIVSALQKAATDKEPKLKAAAMKALAQLGLKKE